MIYLLVALVVVYWVLDQMHDPAKWIYGSVVALLLCLASPAVAADALPMLNAQRAYFHLPPLQFDPVLYAAAERDCQTRAASGRKSHLPIRHPARPGRAEGVGYRSGSDPLGKRFFACYQSTRKYTRAGAAVVVRGNRTFYQLKLR